MLTECDKLSGRLREICRGEANIGLAKTNKYRERWGMEPLARVSAPKSQKIVKGKSGGCGSCGGSKSVAVKNPSGQLNGWGVGSQLAKEYKGRGYPHCPDCHALSVKMDVNGIDWCRANIDELVTDILPRAKALVASAMALVHWGLTITGTEDLILRAKILSDVEEAIRRAEVAPRPKPVPKRQAKRRRDPRAKPAAKPAEPLEPAPYSGPVVRHLIYHLYPAAHTDQWRWNLDQLLKRIGIFNGRKVLGLAIDKSTVSAQVVRDYVAGHGFEIIEVANNPKTGEVATFSKMMQLVETTDPNAIVFYAHGKGTTCSKSGKTLSGGRLPDMKRWAEAMYHGCLDDVEQVDAALVGHAFAGGFRHRKPNQQWLFSGTFFWFRAARVFSKQWELKSNLRWAVEFWPQTLTRYEHNACLFADGVKWLYIPKNLSRALESLKGESPQLTASLRNSPRETSPGVTLVTATGDRPEAFGLCERWMQRQTYSGPLQWIVVDDGVVQTNVTAGQEYIRRPVHRGHTLTQNLQAALPHVRHDKLLFIEDDDWYSPDYVDQMSRWLDADPLVGAGIARYYWPRLARFREFPEHRHASLCRTGVRRDLYDILQKSLKGGPSVDLRLWGAARGRRHDDQILCISPKGMPGRSSGGGDPSEGIRDTDLSRLRQWIGEDVEHYRPVLPKAVDGKLERVVVYTVVLGGYDTIRPPRTINRNVRYVAITDGAAPSPWEVVRPPKSTLSLPHQTRRLKLLAHELFPDADWTIYFDGQLQLAIDPLALVAECQAWGDADLYLFRHQDRDCLFTEARQVVKIGRDRREHVEPLVERYRAAGVPERSGLYLGGMLIRRGGACDRFNEAWWGEVASASHRDQISLPVALQSSGVRFTSLPANWWQHFFLRHPHSIRRRPSARIGRAHSRSR